MKVSIATLLLASLCGSAFAVPITTTVEADVEARDVVSSLVNSVVDPNKLGKGLHGAVQGASTAMGSVGDTNSIAKGLNGAVKGASTTLGNLTGTNNKVKTRDVDAKVNVDA